MLWGYALLFNLMFVLIVVLNFVFQNRFVFECVLEITLPVATIFFFKRFIVWLITKHFLVNREEQKLALRNKKLYFILNFFIFFFDCLVLTFVCFLRVLTSILTSLFFMPRLDCSIYGRHMEKRDAGFMSFVAFLHMEVNQTHPIKLAFCEILKASVKKRNQDLSNARKRWHLIYTLVRNPDLKKHRKHFRSLKKRKFESVIAFCRRQFESIAQSTSLAIINFFFEFSRTIMKLQYIANSAKLAQNNNI